MKKYFKVQNEKEADASHIKVNVDYELGGMSYYTGRTSKRGYYVYVTPVTLKKERGYTSESHMMFDGFKTLLKEVGRKSAKVEAEVNTLFTDADKMNALKQMVNNQFKGKYIVDFNNPDTTV